MATKLSPAVISAILLVITSSDESLVDIDDECKAARGEGGEICNPGSKINYRSSTNRRGGFAGNAAERMELYQIPPVKVRMTSVDIGSILSLMQ